MISAALINKYIHKNFAILIVIFLGLILRLWKINELFPFDHDQEIVARAAYEFIINKKISLIGQELSFQGFFLGPFHNWIGFIPYKFCSLKPDCTPYFFTLISALTIASLYFVVKKILGAKTALIASSIYAISFASILLELNVNSNYFIFLSSTGLFFCLFKYFQEKDRYLILGAYIAGLATVNFNPVFVFSTIAFFIAATIRQKRKIKLFTLAIIAFIINYIPLIAFDFRHQHILYNNFLKFINENSASNTYIERLAHIVGGILLPFLSNFLFQSASLTFIILTLIIIIIGVTTVINPKDKFLLFLPIWISVSIIGFTFYKGHIPDYYFQQLLLPFIVLTSIVLKRHLFVLVIFVPTFLYVNVFTLLNYDTVINYKLKKEAITYIKEDSKDESFNVYYDTPPGLNTGYDYLVLIESKKPQEGGKNLYILEFINPQKLNLAKYYTAFPQKSLLIKNFGYINLVSIK